MHTCIKSLFVVLLAISLSPMLPSAALAQDGPEFDGPPPAAGIEEGRQGPGRRMGEGMRRRGGKGGQDRMQMLRGRARFLKFSKEYYDSVRDPHSAIGFAVLGILQQHRKSKNPTGAIEQLQSLLARTKDQGARNIVLFSMRQVYEKTQDSENFNKINDQILEENLKVVNK